MLAVTANESRHQPRYTRKGWIRKLGSGTIHAVALAKSKDRYFVLEDSSLCYYAFEAADQPLGVLHLLPGTCIRTFIDASAGSAAAGSASAAAAGGPSPSTRGVSGGFPGGSGAPQSPSPHNAPNTDAEHGGAANDNDMGVSSIYDDVLYGDDTSDKKSKWSISPRRQQGKDSGQADGTSGGGQGVYVYGISLSGASLSTKSKESGKVYRLVFNELDEMHKWQAAFRFVVDYLPSFSHILRSRFNRTYGVLLFASDGDEIGRESNNNGDFVTPQRAAVRKSGISSLSQDDTLETLDTTIAERHLNIDHILHGPRDAHAMSLFHEIEDIAGSPIAQNTADSAAAKRPGAVVATHLFKDKRVYFRITVPTHRPPQTAEGRKLRDKLGIGEHMLRFVAPYSSTSHAPLVYDQLYNSKESEEDHHHNTEHRVVQSFVPYCALSSDEGAAATATTKKSLTDPMKLHNKNAAHAGDLFFADLERGGFIFHCSTGYRVCWSVAKQTLALAGKSGTPSYDGAMGDNTEDATESNDDDDDENVHRPSLHALPPLASDAQSVFFWGNSDELVNIETGDAIEFHPNNHTFSLTELALPDSTAEAPGCSISAVIPSKLKDEEPSMTRPHIKITLMGSSGVGKSTIARWIWKYAQERGLRGHRERERRRQRALTLRRTRSVFSSMSIGASEQSLQFVLDELGCHAAELIITDLPGNASDTLLDSHVPSSDLVLAVFDFTDMITFDYLTEVIPRLLQQLKKKFTDRQLETKFLSPAFSLLGTKADHPRRIVDIHHLRDLRKLIGKTLRRNPAGIAYETASGAASRHGQHQMVGETHLLIEIPVIDMSGGGRTTNKKRHGKEAIGDESARDADDDADAADGVDEDAGGGEDEEEEGELSRGSASKGFFFRGRSETTIIQEGIERTMKRMSDPVKLDGSPDDDTGTKKKKITSENDSAASRRVGNALMNQHLLPFIMSCYFTKLAWSRGVTIDASLNAFNAWTATSASEKFHRKFFSLLPDDPEALQPSSTTGDGTTNPSMASPQPGRSLAKTGRRMSFFSGSTARAPHHQQHPTEQTQQTADSLGSASQKSTISHFAAKAGAGGVSVGSDNSDGIAALCPTFARALGQRMGMPLALQFLMENEFAACVAEAMRWHKRSSLAVSPGSADDCSPSALVVSPMAFLDYMLLWASFGDARMDVFFSANFAQLFLPREYVATPRRSQLATQQKANKYDVWGHTVDAVVDFMSVPLPVVVASASAATKGGASHQKKKKAKGQTGVTGVDETTVDVMYVDPRKLHTVFALANLDVKDVLGEVINSIESHHLQTSTKPSVGPRRGDGWILSDAAREWLLTDVDSEAAASCSVVPAYGAWAGCLCRLLRLRLLSTALALVIWQVPIAASGGATSHQSPQQQRRASLSPQAPGRRQSDAVTIEKLQYGTNVEVLLRYENPLDEYDVLASVSPAHGGHRQYTQNEFIGIITRNEAATEGSPSDGARAAEECHRCGAEFSLFKRSRNKCARCERSFCTDCMFPEAVQVLDKAKGVIKEEKMCIPCAMAERQGTDGGAAADSRRQSVSPQHHRPSTTTPRNDSLSPSNAGRTTPSSAAGAAAVSSTIVAKPALWKKDATSKVCELCQKEFSLLKRRHHCRACGGLVCAACSPRTTYVPGYEKQQRVCNRCFERQLEKDLGADANSEQDVNADLDLLMVDAEENYPSASALEIVLGDDDIESSIESDGEVYEWPEQVGVSAFDALLAELAAPREQWNYGGFGPDHEDERVRSRFTRNVTIDLPWYDTYCSGDEEALLRQGDAKHKAELAAKSKRRKVAAHEEQHARAEYLVLVPGYVPGADDHVEKDIDVEKMNDTHGPYVDLED